MRLDLYQAESERIANEQMALLEEAKQRILSGAPLSRLEQSGVLHALQVLIENAIGKSKTCLNQQACRCLYLPTMPLPASNNMAI